MKTLVQLVETALGDGDRDWWFPAEGRVIPLSVLWSNAMGMAGRMSRDHGIGPGDRVLVVLENSSEYVSLLLAIWRLARWRCPSDLMAAGTSGSTPMWRMLARIADYRLIVHEPGTPAFDTAAFVVQRGRSCIALDELRSEATATAGPVAGNRPDDFAVIQFTSGSTGQPKGVIVTHEMMLEQLEQLRENQRYGRDGGPASSAPCPGCPSITTWGCSSACCCRCSSTPTAVPRQRLIASRNPAAGSSTCPTGA